MIYMIEYYYYFHLNEIRNKEKVAKMIKIIKGIGI